MGELIFDVIPEEKIPLEAPDSINDYDYEEEDDDDY